MSDRRIPIHKRSGSGVRLTVHVSESMYWQLVEWRDQFCQIHGYRPEELPVDVFVPALLASIEGVQ